MLVVEVVEDVEEPVLEGEPAGGVRLEGDVGVDGRGVALGETLRPLVVDAAGVERVAGEVEVVLEAILEVGRLRPDLDEVGRVPRPTEGDLPVAKEQVHVDRLERLARLAGSALLDDAHDGCIFLGERRLLGDARERRRGEYDRRERDRGGGEQGAHGVAAYKDGPDVCRRHTELI